MRCSAALRCEVFKHLFAGLVTCVDFSKQNLLCATTTRPEDGIYVVDVHSGKRVQVSYGKFRGVRGNFKEDLAFVVAVIPFPLDAFP